MLGKLMKHELKATTRLLVPLYLVLLCISIINRFLLQSSPKDGVFGFITGFLFIIQITLIIAVLIITVLFMIIRFYKNLLSDEGYLMFTLPVKVHQLITSKLVITLFWIFVSCVVILLSLFIVFFTSNNINMIISEFQRLLAELNATFGGKWILMFTKLALMVIISIVGNILLIYVSIAVGQLFSKHKIIASFVSYAVLYNAIQLIIIIILVMSRYFISSTTDFINMAPQVILSISIVIGLIECITFYAVTNYIFKRKLNLD